MKSPVIKLGSLVLALAMTFGVPSSFADENEVVALKQRVDDLNKKIAMLEQKLGNVEGQVREVSKPAVAHPGHAIVQPQASGGLLHLAENVEFGGHVDVQYSNNFRQPPGGTNTNAYRIFDRFDNSFVVNAAEFYFENPAEEAGEGGFRVDLQYGTDAGIVLGDGLGGDSVDLQQAYVEYIAPLGIFEGNDILPDQIHVKAGRFVTLAGLEVIEAPDNWNISRSFAFGLAIPFTHTGVRTNFGLFNDYFDVYLGVNNGWDTPTETNGDKTLEFGLGYEPLDNVSVFHAWYWGNENADGAGAGNRFLWTNVVTWDVTDKLSIMGDFDWGHEGETTVGTSADWFSLAAYARYQFTDRFSVAARYEIFVDNGAFRTPLAATAGVRGTGGTVDRIWGHTYTAEYKLTDDLIARGEIRHDQANDDNIIGVSESSQVTAAAQLIYVI